MSVYGNSLAYRVVKGAGWTVGTKSAMRVIGLMSTVILARLLVPGDFGLVAVAMMVFGAVEILGDFSFDVPLIRDRTTDRTRYDTAWTLQIIRGIVVGAVLVGTAPLVGDFFGDTRLVPIMWVLAGAAVVAGFGNIGTVNFRKELTLHRDFVLRVSRKVCAVVATVGFAFVWRSYWALVIGIVVGQVAGVVLSFVMHPYRPRLCLGAWRSLLDFSKWLLLRNILLYAIRNIDKVILGRMLGPHFLGLYTVAKEVAELPSSQLIAPMQRVLLPGYAKLGESVDKVREAYLRSASLMLMLAAPCAAGLALLAGPVVEVMLGSKWLEAVPVLGVLAVYGLIYLGTAGTGAVLLALGRPGLLTFIGMTDLAFRVPLLIGGVKLGGVTGAAYGLLVAAAIGQIIRLTVVSRLLALRSAMVWNRVWRTLVALGTMVVVVHGLLEALHSVETVAGPGVELLVGVFVGAIVYVGVHLGLWHWCGSPKGPEAEVLSAMSALLGGSKVPNRWLTRYLIRKRLAS